MMQDLAMQIMEIMQNSISAHASAITLQFTDSMKDNRITFKISDNGSGMSEDTVKKITNPFITSRMTRKIGMGLAFLKQTCDQCDGSLEIVSRLQKGTAVTAVLRRDCIDTPPTGDLGELMMECIQANEKIAYRFEYRSDQGCFSFDTDSVVKELDGVSICEPNILLWIKEFVNQGIQQAKEESK